MNIKKKEEKKGPRQRQRQERCNREVHLRIVASPTADSESNLDSTEQHPHFSLYRSYPSLQLSVTLVAHFCQGTSQTIRARPLCKHQYPYAILLLPTSRSGRPRVGAAGPSQKDDLAQLGPSQSAVVLSSRLPSLIIPNPPSSTCCLQT